MHKWGYLLFTIETVCLFASAVANRHLVLLSKHFSLTSKVPCLSLYDSVSFVADWSQANTMQRGVGTRRVKFNSDQFQLRQFVHKPTTASLQGDTV